MFPLEAARAKDNMDPVRLKKEFGGEICFEGGVDVEHILPFGKAKEVKEHIRNLINIMAPGGGYIFRVQVISHIVPYENLRTAYGLAIEYGRYEM